MVVDLDANIEVSPAGVVLLLSRTHLAAAIARRPTLP
jgi:hypothetical protein